VICASGDLLDGGDGIRFTVTRPTGEEPAFVVRHGGRVRAYLNRCAHVPVELDWQPGRFFDSDRRYLICATHGALYEPGSGYCFAGPCKGRTLVPVEVEERDGGVYLVG
jgi:nitrite reductase/ring-hydroxylating ferredoxin subunit